jgi:hypothetical protein
MDRTERASTHMDTWRESVLFIGTQFSNLYTAVDTPAKGRVGPRHSGRGVHACVCACVRVCVCACVQA